MVRYGSTALVLRRCGNYRERPFGRNGKRAE
jgi:hypothetical protein